MTPEDLRRAIETVWPGHGSQSRCARHFGVSDRRIRYYLAGERAVPAWLAREIGDLAARYPDGLREIDPQRDLAALQHAMEQFGFTASEAAAGILGAALANARRHIGADGVRDLLDGYRPDDWPPAHPE